jgi:DNA primase
MEKAMDFYRAELKKAPRAIEYLKGRGLTGEIAARFRIGYAPDDWQGLKAAFPKYEEKALVEAGLVIENDDKRYDRFRDRVMFPIFNARGAVIGFGGRVMGDGEPKYLNSPETALFQKGQEVYGLVQARDAIRSAGRVLVVEGYMDVVALAQFGVGYAVATLGTATTPVHVAKLLRLTDEIVYCFDGDAAGRKAAWRALENTLPVAPDNKPIKFLFLPEGDDPDTYVRRHGKEKFEALVLRADTLSQFLLSELRAQFNLETAEGRAQFVSASKPHLQKVTAPILRIQLVNAIAELGRVQEEEIRALLKLPESPRFKRPAPAKTSGATTNSLEWRLLYCLLVDLPLVVHIEPSLLRQSEPESKALLAIREFFESEGEASVRLLMERLEGNPALEHILQASRYADELGFSEEEARAEMQGALGKLDEIRRKSELDRMLKTGLKSKEELADYQHKMIVYKRLQGALPQEARAQ